MACDHDSTRRARRWRVAGVSTASLALVLSGLPMAVGSAEATSPAQSDRARCDVKVERPRETRGNDRRKYVNYSFEFTCPRGYRVEVQQRLYEEDRGGDELTGGPYRYSHRFGKDGSWEKTTRARLPNTERRDEEVYHVVRYREFDRRGNDSKWYSEKSRVTTIRH